MVLKFSNKFFSLAGQKERLQNVFGVLKAPFTKTKITSHTGIKTIDKFLSTAAEHPIATAAIGGTVANIPKVVSLVQASRAAKAVKASSKAAGPGIIQKNMSKAVKKANSTGLLDLNELGKPSSSPATFPNDPSGGLIKEPSASSSRVRATRRTTRRRKAAPRRTARKRSRKRSSKRRGYGTAKQYARPGGKTVHYSTKLKRYYITLPNGQWRFVKGKRK